MSVKPKHPMEVIKDFEDDLPLKHDLGVDELREHIDNLEIAIRYHFRPDNIPTEAEAKQLAKEYVNRGIWGDSSEEVAVGIAFQWGYEAGSRRTRNE